MTSRRLLIIDDEVSFGKFVSRVAGDEGFDVEITIRSNDFMAAVRRAPPDVIVLDVFMPGMDGVQLIQWLAEERSTSKRSEAQGIASIAVLLKPFAVATFKATLEVDARVCGRRAAVMKAEKTRPA